MSDDRLRENLRKAGVPDAAIANLDHTSLQAAWAVSCHRARQTRRGSRSVH